MPKQGDTVLDVQRDPARGGAEVATTRTGADSALSNASRLTAITPLLLRNTYLLFCSLFVYRFWARTHIRRYLWQTTHINGEPFEYTGQGRDLFLGFLIALIVIVVPLGIANIYVQYLNTRFGNVFLLAYVPIYLTVQFLVGYGMYRAREYRLSRTQWRGIRFGQTGWTAPYALKFMSFTVLTPLTLGLALPWQNWVLVRHRMRHTWFGDKAFRFEGRFHPLLRRYLILYAINVALVAGLVACSYYLSEVSIGMEQEQSYDPGIFGRVVILFTILLVAAPLFLIYSVFSYLAFQFRYTTRCVSFDGVSFAAQITAPGLAKLHIVNIVLSIATLGLAVPYAQVRSVKYYFNRIAMNGALNTETLRQNPLRKPLIGEGLAERQGQGARGQGPQPDLVPAPTGETNFRQSMHS